MSTDGSLGAAGALPGPAFKIPSTLGKQVGGNLYHSFSQFDLAGGESAIFSGPANVQNILSRVTSGAPSSIDGLVQSTIPGANFYLLNPAGVVFGNNASVDVSGSFAVVTGARIALADGTNFNAAPGASDATLTSAAVSAFGFLPAPAGPITVLGSTLTGATGAQWSLIGGDVQLTDSTLTSSHLQIRAATLALANTKLLTPIASATDRMDIQGQRSITLGSGSIIQATSAGAAANPAAIHVKAPKISLSEGAAINSLSDGMASTKAGNIQIRGGKLVLAGGSRINANTDGATAGGNIDIRMNTASITGLQSGVGAITTAEGKGGNVKIALAQKLAIGAGGTIQTSSFGSGRGGNISISAKNTTIAGGSSFQTGIISDTSANGAAGNVKLTLAGHLGIKAGGQISSDSFSLGAGGDVAVTAASLTIDGGGLPAFTAISAETQQTKGGGAGGNIRLQIGGDIRLSGGGEISAATFGSGKGGSIDLAAANLVISGAGAAFFPGINASTSNETVGGNGGDIRIRVGGDLSLYAGGKIAANTSGTGNGGSASITARQITVSGDGSKITGGTSLGIDGGAGGDLVLKADTLVLSDSGEISASTTGSGAGGSIRITAGQAFLNGGRIAADTAAPPTVGIPVKVSDLKLTLDIDHPNDQNLGVSLYGPDGTFIDLFSGVGGAGQNFHGTVLTDDAATSIADGKAPFTGEFRPLSPLAAYTGIAFNGLWVLILTDFEPKDVASLNSWSLTSGGVTIASPNVPVALPNPDGSNNNVSFLSVALPPASIVPIVAGRGGSVKLSTGSLSMAGQSSISARTYDSGAGGSVNLQVLNKMSVSENSSVAADALLTGKGGDVSVTASELALISGGSISAGTFGQGNGGDVSIHAGSVSLNAAGSDTSGTAIAAGSSSLTDGGRGGDIEITADSLSILGKPGVGASIAATSMGDGASGSVALQLGTLTMKSTASIGSSNTGTGEAGSVSISVKIGVLLDDHSSIATAAATGNAGSISLASGGSIDILNGSFLTASAGNTGGSINVKASDIVQLVKSSITATAGTSGLELNGGSGGNISIAATDIILDHSLISANAALGAGGNIRLETQQFFSAVGSLTATGSTAGTVTITAPVLDLNGALTILDTGLIDASAQLQEMCPMHLGGEASSFLVIGRGGVAPAPDEPQSDLPKRRKGPKSTRGAQ